MLNLLSRLTEHSGHPWAYHASAVLKGGSILALASNQPIRHAELVALGQLWPNKREGTVVWSIRVSRRGTLTMARPCKKCWEKMKVYGVKKVVYSNWEGKLVTERL